ncbi:3-keto-5-aminohexanoate cleavage protein [Flagellimonas allohymeniacidonis]|uniref:3-keto-5-aminohexanoate cleavage protein n=1 Tax=Flagellimonas allohymeniacidonis TaxID=2517819 RepID=A0A4V2HST2_9FLAO|nr:3-keto-5-aminohexanoate cleavage protein [Allomuricauda hymeniacidonis]TAI48960.1 3-keto-5-aminohexanoate cleavage protein [Allomuricauda hymeniacidonis]
MAEKLIINFTPTGMIPTKEITPHVPISVSEIVDDVLRASEIGITMAHLHARDAVSGEPTYQKEIYAEIIEGIRKYDSELVLCISLSGRNFSEFEKRADSLFLDGSLKPDMGSLTLSSLNFNATASMNSPKMIQDLAKTMLERGIVPELEVFDVGMINYAKYLEKKGLIKPPYYFNLILGNIACAQANLLNAGVMINELPENSFWSIGGIGNAQLKMNSLAIAMGGGVRVGIEDNIWYDTQRTRLATNADLIHRIHTIAQANEREVMKPNEFRRKMNMSTEFTDNYGRPVVGL